MKRTTVPQGIFQIKVILVGTQPSIWRRLLVPAEFTLAQLHDVLQITMGWENRHLHEFRIGNQRFDNPDLNDELTAGTLPLDEREVQIADVLNKPDAKAEYSYDFGDSWEHNIAVEKIVPPEPGLNYPFCIGGELHCPPEDCGGVGGFNDFLEAMRDPSHDEHEEMMDWCGGIFDPESFSLDAVNKQLHNDGGDRRARPDVIARALVELHVHDFLGWVWKTHEWLLVPRVLIPVHTRFRLTRWAYARSI